MNRFFDVLSKIDRGKNQKENFAEDPIIKLDSFKRLQEKFGPRQDLRENGFGPTDLTAQDFMDVLTCYFSICKLTTKYHTFDKNEIIVNLINMTYGEILDIAEELPPEELSRTIDISKIIPVNRSYYELYHHPGGINISRKFDRGKPGSQFIFFISDIQKANEHRHLNFYFRASGIPFKSSFLDEED